MNYTKLIIGVVVAGLIFSTLVAVEAHGYKSGYNQASIEYETRLSEQKTQFINDQAQLESQLSQANKQVAEKANQVHQVFVPVEKEIIKYVSRKPNPDDKCGVDVSRWMQLHNAATNPYDVQSRASLNGSTANATGVN